MHRWQNGHALDLHSSLRGSDSHTMLHDYELALNNIFKKEGIHITPIELL